MAESSSFSSLLALVENHLSKTNLQESRSEIGGLSTGPIPTLGGTALSDIKLPSCNKISLPKLTTTGSPITNLVAEQVSNMLKAKERKKKEEEDKKRLLEENKLKLEEANNSIIDLMQALQTPTGQRPVPQSEDHEASIYGSVESLLHPKFADNDMDVVVDSPEPPLPCTTDMSYILKIKVRRGKCSAFGKVLTSRLKPVAAPYLHENIQNPNIERFMFTTPSPCDIIKAKQELPYTYQTDR